MNCSTSDGVADGGRWDAVAHRLAARFPRVAGVILRSPLARRVSGGMFWSLLGGVLGRGFLVVSGVIAARVLGNRLFGAVGIIQNTIVMFGAFAGFGMGMTATKYVAEYRNKDPARAGSILALSRLVAVGTGGAATLLLFLLAPWLATHSLSAPELSGALRVSSVVFLLMAINGVQQGALSGLESFRTLAWVNLWTGLASFLLTAACVTWGGFDGAIWALVLSALATCMITALALRRDAQRAGVPLRIKPSAGDWGVLVRYSLPAVLSQVVVGPVRWLCSVMLVNAPNGYVEMGVFNATMQWSQVIVFLSTAIANVSIPILAERLGQGDHRSSTRVLKGSVLATAAMVIPVIAGGSLLSPWIMGAYGHDFRRGWPTLVISFLTAGLMAVEAPVGTVIQASERMWWGAWMNLAWGIALIALTWVAIPLGALGLALAMLGAYVLHGLWTVYCARLILKRQERESVPSAVL